MMMIASHGFLGFQIGLILVAWLAEMVSLAALHSRSRTVVRIRGNQKDVQFIYLRGTRELLSRRLSQRRDHFMPPDLLESQLDLLEEPSADEHAIVVTIDRTPNDLVMTICDGLGLS